MSLLEVRNLKVYFPIRTGVLRRHTGDVKAVDNVSFSVESGTTVGLVGESGSGKTSVARAVLGLAPTSSGTIAINGKTLSSRGRSRLKEVGREVQMVFQQPGGSLDPEPRLRLRTIPPVASTRRV